MSGSIKTYTPNFKMIIPEFNVATWHDYIEENFRSIDALFHNLFGINGFSGIWKTNSQYTIGQVLFIGEDNGSMYEGRLVKVIQDTNTGGFATFSEAIKRYPNHYEMYADASSAEIFALLAQDWAIKTGSTVKTPTGEDTGEYSAKHHAQVAAQHEEACEMYRNLAKTDSDLAKESEIEATSQAQIAITQATNAATSATNAKTSETKAKTSENNALSYKNSAQSSASSAQTSAQNAANSATTATNAANSSNVQTVVTNMSAINTCSSNMSAIKDAPNQANRAKLYADQAQAVTDGTLNETQITNCITEIPQDIKLELNNGALTLKAGSKVYVPNGAGVFDVVIVSTDKTLGTIGSVTGQTFLIYDSSNNALSLSNVATTLSGSSAPSNFSGVFYNSTNNIISGYSNGVADNKKLSLPIAIYTRTSGVPTSIDQVFNGFGYIGSTVFALPNVKGLIPNGRNTDGTLKNTNFTINNVLTTTDGSGATGGLEYYINGQGIYRANFNTYFYDEKDNYYKNTSGVIQSVVLLDPNAYRAGGKISSFNPKPIFRAVEYNDFTLVKNTFSTKQDIATAVNYDNITNCITHIPQDIKLELNNGTLTLKSGSVITKPDGGQTITNQDRTYTQTGSDSYQGVLFVAGSNGSIQGLRALSRVGSGASLPADGSVYQTFLNTTDLKIYAYSGGAGSWIEWAVALPIAICTLTSGVITSIDKIFNGFGYIGSTVFVLPGVKGLISNGRNEDGTLKNIEFTLASVKINTRTNDTANTLVLSGNDVSQQRFPAGWNYDAEKNIVYSVAQKAQRNYCVVGQVSSVSTKITSFQPKTLFRAIDYNDAVKYSDKETVVGWGMPNLATKTEYTSDGSTTLNVTLDKRKFVSLYCGVLWDNQNCGFKVGGVEVCKALYQKRVSASFHAILEAGTNITSFVSATGSNYDIRILTYDLKG